MAYRKFKLTTSQACGSGSRCMWVVDGGAGKAPCLTCELIPAAGRHYRRPLTLGAVRRQMSCGLSLRPSGGS